MARTADDILVGVLGNQALALAKMQATIEAQKEEIAALKTRVPPQPETPP